MAEADTFDKFKTSLISFGKTADGGNVSVFTSEDLKVFKENIYYHNMQRGANINMKSRQACEVYNPPCTKQRAMATKEANQSIKEISEGG